MFEMENKAEICQWIRTPISMTRAGEGIKDIVYNEMTKHVEIIFEGGYKKLVNVFGDSGIAMISDICRALM